MSWIDNITRSHKLIEGRGQTDLAVIVSGSRSDRDFWSRETEKVKRDIFREDGCLDIACLTEEKPAGNFLGTLKAWCDLKNAPTRGVSIMSMVFGQGKRFSPFTQTMGNRKAAFPTPFRARHSGSYLRTGDIAILYSSLWMNHLAACNF